MPSDHPILRSMHRSVHQQVREVQLLEANICALESLLPTPSDGDPESDPRMWRGVLRTTGLSEDRDHGKDPDGKNKERDGADSPDSPAPQEDDDGQPPTPCDPSLAIWAAANPLPQNSKLWKQVPCILRPPLPLPPLALRTGAVTLPHPMR